MFLVREVLAEVWGNTGLGVFGPFVRVCFEVLG